MDEKRMVGDYTVINSMYIGHREIILGENPKAASGERYVCCYAERVMFYGMLRRTFLREHRDGIYTGMLLEGTLNSHLEEVDAQANRMMDKLTEQMKTLNGVTEQMKAEDQMKWVQLMNSIRNSAEEVVLRDLIYA